MGKFFGTKVKCLILIGATKFKIEESVKNTGFKNIIIVETFREAFDEAVMNAVSGDAVLYPLHVQVGACLQTSKKEAISLRIM